jgi:hypothetical protein
MKKKASAKGGKKKKPVLLGTIRVRAKDLVAVEKTEGSWRKAGTSFPDLLHAVHLFSSHHRFQHLVDKMNPAFLKGQLSPDGRPQGARIGMLPDGTVLNGAFSLFARHLRFHCEDTDMHWDVMYENPSGFTYLYTKEKIEQHKKRKVHVVDEFSKVYPILKRRVLNKLRTEDNIHPMALYTLMKTYMRVGNDIYYRAHGHKGLTTLQKEDIEIVDSRKVQFDYIAKDGVPVTLTARFPDIYVTRLAKLLDTKKKGSFVFSENDHPLHGKDLKKAIERLCGKPFYPHIIRSYYADMKVREFFRAHRKATKQEVQELLIHIAEKLGHKRFDKKSNTWVESPKVTVNNYIRPEYVQRLHSYYM